jgi:hypothetical protein
MVDVDVDVDEDATRGAIAGLLINGAPGGAPRDTNSTAPAPRRKDHGGRQSADEPGPGR